MTRWGVSRGGVVAGLFAMLAVAVAAWLMYESPAIAAARLRDVPPVAVEALDTSSYVRVVVQAGMSGEDIATALQDAGVVSDQRRFVTLLAVSGAAAHLQAGCYELPRRLPSAEVIRRMRAGITTGRTLAIPEGLRAEEVADRGVRAGVGISAEWDAAFARIEAEPGPVGRPRGASLVGYLFPAAYPLECDTTAESLVRAMVKAFGERVSPALFAEASRAGLSPDQVITLASIVEREAVKKEERGVIASVYLNRLDDEIGLAADPTVQFAVATPESVAKFGWWKRELTVTDLKSRSAYNTYVHEGLPPGPIASPGLDAIIASVRPERTDFLYFVAKGDGTHAFAKTLAEHNRNVATYQLGQ